MSDKPNRGQHPNSLANLTGEKFSRENPDFARRAQAAGVANRRARKMMREDAEKNRQMVAKHFGKTIDEITSVDFIKFFAEEKMVEGNFDEAAELFNKVAPYEVAKRASVQQDVNFKPMEELSDEELEAKLQAALGNMQNIALDEDDDEDKDGEP